MGGTRNLHELGDRIERLLTEIRSMASPSIGDRVDEVVRSIVELYGAGLARIMELAASTTKRGDSLGASLVDDDLIASLLILHGLHPENFTTRVHKALERVRPYLGSHGGDIEIVQSDGSSGSVRLRMKGSCDGCPSSLLTVKLAVESAIREAAPEVTQIEVEGISEPSSSPSSPAAGPSSSWVTLEQPDAIGAQELAVTEVAGAQIMLCRVDGHLYAYRDACPSCGSAMDNGRLEGDVVACPSCKRGYDVRLAGRSIDGDELHLEPLPLLESGNERRSRSRNCDCDGSNES